METEGLRAFCHSITGENAGDGRDVYVRMRSGKSQSGAKTVCSGIHATGESSIQLAYDLERRYLQLSPENPVWLEAVLEGTSKVIDTLKLPPYDGELETANMDLQTQDAALCRLTDALVSTVQEANENARFSQSLFLESNGQMMKIFQALARTQAELSIVNNSDRTDNISEALSLLGDSGVLGAIAGKVGGAPTEKPPGPPPEMDVERATDDMVTALATIASAHPEVVTPDRISKLVSIVKGPD